MTRQQFSEGESTRESCSRESTNTLSKAKAFGEDNVTLLYLLLPTYQTIM